MLPTVAFNGQVGCVLLQQQKDGTNQPIGYWSYSANQAQRPYDTTHRKFHAVASAVLLLRLYVEETISTIRTDHDSLKCILNLSDATGMLVRWLLRLSEFDFNIIHRKMSQTKPLMRCQDAKPESKTIKTSVITFTSQLSTTMKTKTRNLKLRNIPYVTYVTTKTRSLGRWCPRYEPSSEKENQSETVYQRWRSS